MIETPPVDSDATYQWYVALVRSGREQFAKEHLLASGFDEAFYPRKRSVRQVRGKPLEFIGPLIHGYVLVRTDFFTAFLWHLAVRGKDHRAWGLVRGFIGGWPPFPTPVEDVEITKSMCDEEGIALPILEAGPVLYEPGTVVRVSGDVYDNQTFVVVWDNGSKGVNLRSLQGAQFPLYIRERERVSPLLQVEPVQASKKDRAPRLAKGIRRGPYGIQQSA